MIDWEKHHESLAKRNAKDIRAEQLAGNDLAFWATFHDQHGKKFKDLCESVILDLRYGRRLDLTSDILIREGIEALQKVMYTCSLEVKKQREPRVEKIKRKI